MCAEKILKPITVQELFESGHTIAWDIFTDVTYPYEVLPKISDYIMMLGESLPTDRYEQIDKDIWVSRSAIVAETAHLHGPLIIDEEAEIRHCAFIRGNAIVGKQAVVGNSTELKNVILFDRVQVPHYNYVGDSILGYRSHMGAGSITSNVKSDKTKVAISIDGERIPTDLKKMGAILGDRVEVGCGSILNPGTIIGHDANLYPLSSVRGYIPPQTIYKKQGEVVDKH